MHCGKGTEPLGRRGSQQGVNAWSCQSVVGLPLSGRKDGHGIEGDGNENDKHLGIKIKSFQQCFPFHLLLSSYKICGFVGTETRERTTPAAGRASHLIF